MLLIFHINSSH